MSRYCKLVNQELVPCDVREWARWFERTEDRIVAQDYVDALVQVSTVFLGLDHGMGGGRPLFFETMVFGGPDGGYQERYSTYVEAVEGHARVLAAVREGRRLGEGAPTVEVAD